MRKAGSLLAATAVGLGALAARAEEADRLNWGFGEDAYRYDLEEDAGQRVAPDAGLAPALEKVKLVSNADFERTRRLKTPAADLSDLIWFYALFLPDGEYGPKGGAFPVNETFHLHGLDVVATGKDEVTRPKAGRVQLKATLDLAGGWVGKGTTLTVERGFDSKKKLVTDAKFSLDLRRNHEGKVLVFKHAGKIALAGKVDASAKGFLSDVNAAIKRGTSFVQERLAKKLADFKGNQGLKKGGAQALGQIALPTFALLRSGVPPEKLKDAFDYMAACEWKEVYSVSLYLMCLEARSVRRDDVPPSAGGRTVARFSKIPPAAGDKNEMARAARWLIAVRKHGQGWWSYAGDPGHESLDPGPSGKGTAEKKGGPSADDGHPLGHDLKTPAEGGDRSNSQFAVLALHAAASCDIPIDAAIWKEIADEILSSQEADGPAQSIKDVEWTAAAPAGIAPDGGADPFQPNATRSRDKLQKDYGEGSRARGWHYGTRNVPGNGSAYGSMTGAGVSSLAIAREGLRRAGKLDPETDVKSRTAIHDGVAWWIPNWTTARNPRNGAWYYYYLYSVEKAMETAGVEKFGGHEWWREGAAELLAIEDAGKKGSWSIHGREPLEDTSFVLLFLNRATLPATIITQDSIRSASGERDPDAWDQVFVEGTGHVRLRQVFYAVETATTELLKDRLKIAEKGFDTIDEDKRPRLVPDLLRLLSSPNKDVHRFALRALRVAAGTEDEPKVRSFFHRWQELAAACTERNYDAIPAVRATLREKDSTYPLKRTCCTALSRLRAIEALGDLIAELSDKDVAYRRVVATTIVNLVGTEKCPYDPSGSDADRAKGQADWKAWWEKSRETLVVTEEARRSVEALAGDGAATAQAKLRQFGKHAVRPLIDGLIDPSTKEKSHALLKEITKQGFPAETAPWLEWWEKNQPKG